MKRLQLSDLENISGGNIFHEYWKPILCTIITTGVVALTYPVLDMLLKAAGLPNLTELIQSKFK